MIEICAGFQRAPSMVTGLALLGFSYWPVPLVPAPKGRRIVIVGADGPWPGGRWT